MDNFHFDAKTHTYTLNGKILPSVTQILKAENYIDDSFYTQEAADNGTRRHLIFHLDDLGILLDESVDKEDLPYLSAWRQFKVDTNFKLIESETPVYSKTYAYACTPDKRATVIDFALAIVEIKTGILMPWTALQTAAQALCFDDYHHRIGVEVGEGKYKIYHFTDRHDREVWFSCFMGYIWKKVNLRRQT